MSAREDQITDRQSTPLGVLARLWWMLLGNVILVLSFLLILRHEGSFFHLADWVFWIAVASLLLIRYLDVKLLDGQTATGRYATMTDWLRYMVLLLACSAVLWGIAHAANHLGAGKIVAS